MNWRFFGILLLLLTITLAIFTGYQVFETRTNNIWVNTEVSIPSGIGHLSATLSPSQKEGYKVMGTIVPQPVYIDSMEIPPDLVLWVVNSTGLDLLMEEAQTGIAPPGYPPKAYALVLGVKDRRDFELQSLDYDGEYYFFFGNPQVWDQSISITLTESWQAKEALIEPNLMNLMIIGVIAISGLYLVVKNPEWFKKKPKKKAREHRRALPNLKWLT